MLKLNPGLGSRYRPCTIWQYADIMKKLNKLQHQTQDIHNQVEYAATKMAA